MKSVSYTHLDVYKRQGMGPLLGYLPCSPHCKPEVREDNEIHNDYDFFRPVIRVQTSGWRMVIDRAQE